MSRVFDLLRMVFVLAMLAALVYFGVSAVVLGVKRIADYEPTTYTPVEQSARDWGHEYLYEIVTVVCENQTCLVWAHYNNYKSTSPPILLNCTPVCVPDLQRSVTIPKEHTQ